MRVIALFHNLDEPGGGVVVEPIPIKININQSSVVEKCLLNHANHIILLALPELIIV